MENTVILIENKVKELTEEFDVLKNQIDEVKDWDSISEIITNINRLWDFASNLVSAVELATYEVTGSIEGLKGPEKLDIASRILDDHLKLPFWLELIDGPILKIALSLIVETLNREYGKEWNLDWVREGFEKGKNTFEHIKSKATI